MRGEFKNKGEVERCEVLRDQGNQHISRLIAGLPKTSGRKESNS